MTRPQAVASWSGRRAAKSSMAASTTAVAGGGGSGHSLSVDDDCTWQRRSGSCSQEPKTGWVIYTNNEKLFS